MAETIQITHYDLDGAVCAILVKYAIKTHGCPGYHQGKVERVTAVYERIPEVIFNSIAVQKHNGKPIDFIITDLRISSSDLARAVESDWVRSLLYIDHHERDGETDLATVDYVSDKFDWMWMKGQFAGAALVLKYFTQQGVKFPDSLVHMARCTDAFDEWKTYSKFFEEGVNLNEMFWELGFDRFVDMYSEGCLWDKQDKVILERILKEKDDYFTEAEERTAMLEFKNGKKCLVSMQPGGKWANEYTLRWDADVYLILGKAKTGVITFSSRCRDNSTRINEVAKKTAESLGGSGGGHYTAAGFYVPGDTELSTVVETFMETLENS